MKGRTLVSAVQRYLKLSKYKPKCRLDGKQSLMLIVDHDDSSRLPHSVVILRPKQSWKSIFRYIQGMLGVNFFLNRKTGLRTLDREF